MSARRDGRGFVLLVVLGAVAVLSLIAAFIYSQTEDQLVLSIAARGQSVAASRATLAAERTLALYRGTYATISPTLAAVTPSASYEAAKLANAVVPQVVPAAPAPGDRSIDLTAGGGAQWCVEVWRLARGGSLPPWTIIEAHGYYGYTSPTGGLPDFVHCQPQPPDNSRMFTSRVTVSLDGSDAASACSGPCDTGGGGGTGTAGGS